MKFLDKSFHAKRISPHDGEYFFGYYDLQPFCGNLHLTHKIKDANTLHDRGDKAEVGILDINTAKYEKLDETGAWCFQQGAMLQWNPASPKDEVIYNSLTETDYNATILNIHTGKKRFLDRPVANVSPLGDYALSINFGRMYDFRPGYGYAEFRDGFYWDKHSKEDGVFLIDLKTGKSKLVLSMDEIWEFCKGYFGGRDEKLIINHINFNTDGSRFVMLVRNFPSGGQGHKTALITANRDGSDMYMLSDFGIQSHYHWKDKETLLIYSDGKELKGPHWWGGNYIMKDKTHEGYLIADGWFTGDNHMSFSPDRKLMLTDKYPLKDGTQPIRIYSFEKNICVNMGYFHSIKRDSTDLRCDLHPRWNQDGSMISFDSTHEGRRDVYVMDIESIKDHLFDEY